MVRISRQGLTRIRGRKNPGFDGFFARSSCAAEGQCAGHCVNPSPHSHHQKMSFESVPTMSPRLSPLPAVLDEQALSRLRELDPGGSNRLLERVVTAFLKSLDQQEPVLAGGRDGATDLGGLRHVAHTLKSAAASLGATALSARCADIEALARDGDAAALGAPLDAVLAEIAAVRLAMQRLLQSQP